MQRLWKVLVFVREFRPIGVGDQPSVRQMRQMFVYIYLAELQAIYFKRSIEGCRSVYFDDKQKKKFKCVIQIF